MRFKTTAGVLAAAIIGLSGPALAQDDTPGAETVVATVNGDEITLGHMIVLRSRLPEQYQTLPDDVLFQGILDQLVRQTVLGQQIDGGLTRQNELILANERRALLAAQAIAAASEAAATDEAIQSAYDSTYGQSVPEREFNASHILVETEEEALALIEQLQGGADFAQLARDNSTGPSGPNGGELGWFTKGMMVPDFENAVIALEVGEVSDPVQTQFGWHVVTLNDARDIPPPALEDVRDQLAQSVGQTAVEAALEELTAMAEIDRAGAEALDPSILRELSLITE